MYYKSRNPNIKVQNNQESELENLRDRMTRILGTAVAGEFLASDIKGLKMTIEIIVDLASPENDYQAKKHDAE